MKASNNERVYKISFASVYPLYITKAEKKGRTKSEVDEVIRWLTGFSQEELEAHLEHKTNFEDLFAVAQLHPNAPKNYRRYLWIPHRRNRRPNYEESSLYGQTH